MWFQNVVSSSQGSYQKVSYVICGYGSLTIAIKLIIVRLKGSGAPCLQSYFQDAT